ncbi:MAG: hypothetical protein ACXAE3_10210 [Candidatus Kariarchaeaceae archaeon]|jgi:hypothetical protein
MSEFEFNDEHNAVITIFSNAMYYMSITMMILGVLTLGKVFFTGFVFTDVLLGFAWMVMAAGFFFPVDNFRNIVNTEGKDITELITGFSEIRSGWTLVSIILGLYLLLKIADLSGIV